MLPPVNVGGEDVPRRLAVTVGWEVLHNAMRSWCIQSREDLSEWIHNQGFPRPRWGAHFSGKDAVSRSSVDDFWSIWSSNAEAGLLRAFSQAGGPTEAGSSAFPGRGLLRIRRRRLGGRAAGGTGSSRLFRVSPW